MPDQEDVAAILQQDLESLKTLGVRRTPKFPPALLQVIGVSPSAADHQAHRAVFDALLAAADFLDPTLRSVYINVLGFSRNAPASAQERFINAGKEMGSSDRTARRHFSRAVELVAREMAGRHLSGSSPDEDCTYVRSRTWVDLRSDRPVLATERTIIARIDGVAHIEDRVGFPKLSIGSPEIQALEGCRIENLRQIGTGVWEYRMAFRKPLRLGEQHSFAVSIQLPHREALEPIIAFMPRSNSYDASVEIRFGARRPVAMEHFVTRPPVDGLHRIPGATLVPTVKERHTFTFQRMRPGYFHGIKWYWNGDALADVTDP